jgi:GT2 family glycosyltransferase
LINDKICVLGVLSNNAGHQSVEVKDKSILEFFMRPYENILIHGFCIFVNIDVCEKIGFFNCELFPHYGSEDDLCIRAYRNGYKNIIATNIYVTHYGSKSYTQKQRAEIMLSSCPALSKLYGEKTIRNYCTKANYVLNDFRKRIKNYENNKIHRNSRRQRFSSVRHTMLHGKSAGR